MRHVLMQGVQRLKKRGGKKDLSDQRLPVCKFISRLIERCNEPEERRCIFVSGERRTLIFHSRSVEILCYK